MQFPEASWQFVARKDDTGIPAIHADEATRNKHAESLTGSFGSRTQMLVVQALCYQGSLVNLLTEVRIMGFADLIWQLIYVEDILRWKFGLGGTCGCAECPNEKSHVAYVNLAF